MFTYNKYSYVQYESVSKVVKNEWGHKIYWHRFYKLLIYQLLVTNPILELACEFYETVTFWSILRHMTQI